MKRATRAYRAPFTGFVAILSGAALLDCGGTVVTHRHEAGDGAADASDHATTGCTTEVGCGIPGYYTALSIPKQPEGPNYYTRALMGDGTLFVGGGFVGKVDFDPGPGTDLRDVGDMTGGFVSKFGADGKYAWTRIFPNAGDPFTLTMSAGPDGSVVVGGTFSRTVDFDPGTGVDEHTPRGSSEAFVMKLLADGSLAWARTFAGTLGSWGSVQLSSVGQNGSVLVSVGHTGTVDMDPGPAEHLGSAPDGANFLAALTPSGDLVWAYRYPDCMQVSLVAVEPDGTARIGGQFFMDCSFDPAGGTKTTHLGQIADGFVASFAPSGAYKGAMTFGGIGANVDPTSLTLRPDGSMILGGSFSGMADLDPGPGRAERGELSPTTVTGFLVATTANDTLAWVHTLPGDLVASTASVANSSVLAIANRNDSTSFRVLGFGSDGNSIWSLALPGGHIISFDLVAADATGVSVFGLLNGPVDLDPGPGTHVFGTDGKIVFFTSRYVF